MVNTMLKGSLAAASNRPLPLKQRTSSVDARRDFTTQTWTSLLDLLKVREYIITVDHFSIWRRHLAWAMENGGDLREYMTKRYASSMVFMSLLLSTELAVLFNSASVASGVRDALAAEEHSSIQFWVGICIIMSAVFTILSLLSIFTAWTMVSSISNTNAHCILRSSIGQYAAELPGRFIVCSIYSFLLWLIMFFFILLPVGIYSSLLLLVVGSLFLHTIITFSSFGRVIMHSGAMGNERIFDSNYEMTLMPHGLHNNLLTKACANLSNNTSIMRQYRSKQQPIDRTYSQEELSSLFLSDRRSATSSTSTTSSSMDHQQVAAPITPPPPPIQKPQPARIRTGSLVRFADGCDTSGHPPDRAPPPLMRQDAKGTNKPKSLVPSLVAGGHQHSTMSRPTTNNSTSKPEQHDVVSNDGENSPLLQEWLLSSNNSLPLYNASPTPLPTHPPPATSHSNNHATWTTENIPPPPPSVANKTLLSNDNKIQQGQQPQRPSLWNRNSQQRHAGYGAVTATTTTTATTGTTAGTTTAALPYSNSDPFVENVPARVGGGTVPAREDRAYSMVSELSEDDDDDGILAENDGYFYRAASSSGTTHEDDVDKSFEEEYGFNPDVSLSDGDKDEITDAEEESSSSQELVLGLNIETDSISEPQQQQRRADLESGSHGRSNKRQG